MILIKNKNDFQRHVINYTEKTVLLNFWTWWSDGCITMSTTLHSLPPNLKKKYSIVWADWDQQKWLVDTLQIYGVPTLLIFKNGKVKGRLSGVISPAEILSHLTNHL